MNWYNWFIRIGNIPIYRYAICAIQLRPEQGPEWRVKIHVPFEWRLNRLNVSNYGNTFVSESDSQNALSFVWNGKNDVYVWVDIDRFGLFKFCPRMLNSKETNVYFETKWQWNCSNGQWCQAWQRIDMSDFHFFPSDCCFS